MRTAVLISGQFRTGTYCFPSIKKHVLDRIGDYDVFAHLADDADAKGIEDYKPLALWVGPQPTLDEKNYIHRTGRQVFGVQQCLRMWRSMHEVWKMAQQSGIGYDWVIRLRPDTQFFNDIENLGERAPGVHIPKHNNWWGYCDRFAYMRFEHAPAYHSLFPGLDHYIMQGGIFHPETYLKWTLDSKGVPVHRTGVVFDTVRPSGDRILPHYTKQTLDVG